MTRLVRPQFSLPRHVVDQLGGQYDLNTMIAVGNSALSAAGFAQAAPEKTLRSKANDRSRASIILTPMPYASLEGELVQGMLDTALNEAKLDPEIKTVQLFLPIQGDNHWGLEEMNCVRRDDGNFDITSLTMDSAMVFDEAIPGVQQQSGGDDCGPAVGLFIKQRAVGDGKATSVLRDVGSTQKFRAGVCGIRATQIEDLERFPVETPADFLEAGETIPTAVDLLYASYPGLPPEETFATGKSQYLQANPCGANDVYTLQQADDGAVLLSLLAPNIAQNLGAPSNPGKYDVCAIKGGTVRAVFDGGRRIEVEDDEGNTYEYGGMVKGATPDARALLVNQKVRTGDRIEAGEALGQVWNERDGIFLRGHKPEFLLRVTDAYGENVDLIEEFRLRGHDETHQEYRLEIATAVAREMQRQTAEFAEMAATPSEFAAPPTEKEIVLPETDRQRAMTAAAHLLGSFSAAIAPNIGRIAPPAAPPKEPSPLALGSSMQMQALTPPTPPVMSAPVMPIPRIQPVVAHSSARIVRAPHVPAPVAASGSGIFGRFLGTVANVAESAANLALRPFTLPGVSAQKEVAVASPSPSLFAATRRLETSEVVQRLDFIVTNGAIQEVATDAPSLIGVNMIQDYTGSSGPREILYVDNMIGNAKPVTDLNGNPLGNNQWVLNGRYLLTKNGNDLQIGPVGYRNDDGSQLVTCMARGYFSSPQNALNTGITLGQEVPANPSYNAAQALTFGSARTQVSASCAASADARNVALTLSATGSQLVLSNHASNGVEFAYFNVDSFDVGSVPAFYKSGSTNYVVYQKDGAIFNRQISAASEPTGGINSGYPSGATLVSGDVILGNGAKFSATSVSQPVTVDQTSYTVCALLGAGLSNAPTSDGAEVYFQGGIHSKLKIQANPNTALVASGDLCAKKIPGIVGCDIFSGVDFSALNYRYTAVTGSRIQNEVNVRLAGDTTVNTQTYGGVVADNGQQIINPAMTSGAGAAYGFDDAQIHYDGPSFTKSRSLSRSVSKTISLSRAATASRTPSRVTSPSATASQSVSRSSAASQSASGSESATESLTESLTASVSGSRTTSRTKSASDSASKSASDTASESETASQSESISESSSNTPTRTRTRTRTRTQTKSNSESASSSASVTAGASDTASSSSSESDTATFSQTPSHSDTAQPSESASNSGTNSTTDSSSKTRTASATDTQSVTQTVTSTSSITASDTPSETPSPSAKASPSVTTTDSVSASASAPRSPSATVSPPPPPSTTATRSLPAKPSASKSSSEIPPSPPASPTPTPTPPEPTAQQESDDSSNNSAKIGIIAGIVGGAVVLGGAGVAAWRHQKRKTARRRGVLPVGAAQEDRRAATPVAAQEEGVVNVSMDAPTTATPVAAQDGVVIAASTPPVPPRPRAEESTTNTGAGAVVGDPTTIISPSVITVKHQVLHAAEMTPPRNTGPIPETLKLGNHRVITFGRASSPTSDPLPTPPQNTTEDPETPASTASSSGRPRRLAPLGKSGRGGLGGSPTQTHTD